MGVLFLSCLPAFLMFLITLMPSKLPLIRRPALPLLITGITGVAGYNALHYFQKRYPGQVIGIRPRKAWRLSGDCIIELDIEQESGLRQLFREYRFGSVLNCIGNCECSSKPIQ